MWKVVFKNSMGKVLYQADVSGKTSKQRRVPEKEFKKQIKIAVQHQDEITRKWTIDFCLVNFDSNEHREQFENTFKDAISELKAESD